MKDLKLIGSVASVLIVVLLSAMVGFHFGKREGLQEAKAEKPIAVTPESPKSKEKAPAAEKKAVESPTVVEPKTQPKQAQRNVITPEQLAKSAGISPSLKNASGEYTLVSVIDGAQHNLKFRQNIQLVTAQRQQLTQLAQQFDKAPVNAVQQRELLAGKINEVNNTLKSNLQFMERSYVYNFQNVYIQLPFNVVITLQNKVKGKVETKLVHEFTTAKAYAEFQKDFGSYLNVKMQITSLKKKQSEKKSTAPASVEPVAAPEGDTEVAKPKVVKPKIKDLAKIEKLKAQKKELSDNLIQKYKFDPEFEHKLIIKKTALYARGSR